MIVAADSFIQQAVALRLYHIMIFSIAPQSALDLPRRSPTLAGNLDQSLKHPLRPSHLFVGALFGLVFAALTGHALIRLQYLNERQDLELKFLWSDLATSIQGSCNTGDGVVCLRTSLELFLEKPELTSLNQHKGGVLGTSEMT